MFPMTILAEAIQAEREREFRNRHPRVVGIPSGRRHPRIDEGAVPESRPQPATPTGFGRPAVAGSR